MTRTRTVVHDGSARVAVIGDVGGHAAELRAELARLGVPDEGRGPIPSDLTIVQLGDLVHRGPDSEDVVRQVDGYLRSQPRQWVQLVGNHEALYLRRSTFQWPHRVDHVAADRIRAWWAEGLMIAAATIETPGRDYVLTHAGITSGFWRLVLGAPASASEIADAVNGLASVDHPALYRAGVMLNGRPPDALAGPLWAAAGTELATSWAAGGLPASQVHGHSTAYDWATDRWRIPPALRDHARLDHQSRHVTLDLPGGRLIGIDPGHHVRPTAPWRAWQP